MAESTKVQSGEEAGKEAIANGEKQPALKAVSEREKILLPAFIALLGVFLATGTGLIAAKMTFSHQLKQEKVRHSHENRVRFHQERRELYARFLTVANDVYEDMHYAKSLSGKEGVLVQAFGRNYSRSVGEKSEKLRQLLEEINLISSAEVREAAKKIAGEPLLFHLGGSLDGVLDMMKKAGGKPVGKKSPQEIIDELKQAGSYEKFLNELKPRFLKAAREELGIGGEGDPVP